MHDSPSQREGAGGGFTSPPTSRPDRRRSPPSYRSGEAFSGESASYGKLPTLFLTCEHGGNLIPSDLASLFHARDRLLHSHRAWDPGALQLAGHLAAALQVPLHFALISRLVVDLNRSLDNPTLLSEFTRDLPSRARRDLLARHYHPYRRDVEATITRLSRRAPVVHVSVHTFTPLLRGHRRDVDIGLLFDPARAFERRVASAWGRQLQLALPRLRIRRNKPYKGTDDGLTTHLRARLPDRRYAGIELEVNQRFPRRAGPAWSALQESIAASLRAALLALPEHAAR